MSDIDRILVAIWFVVVCVIMAIAITAPIFLGG
jgi:hypothetical protein